MRRDARRSGSGEVCESSAAIRGGRFDRRGEIGVVARPLAVEDHQRREWQRGSNGAATTERGGVRGLASPSKDGAVSLLCPDLFTQQVWAPAQLAAVTKKSHARLLIWYSLVEHYSVPPLRVLRGHID